MNVITIPRSFMKEKELVIIPRQEYEKLLAGQRVEQKAGVKRSVSFRVPQKHTRFYKKLDQELTEAREDVKRGKSVGPFVSVKEMKKSLEK